MEASSTAIMEEPRDDIIVSLVFLCLAVMVFEGVYRLSRMVFVGVYSLSRMVFVGVYRAIRKRPERAIRKRPERRWKPMSEKEAMDRVNSMLQRKLEEVESLLLEHPPSTYIHDDGLYRTARRIDFIKNLLTAEMNSRSPHMQENLNRMATRLSIIQKAFVEWASPISRFSNSKLDETLANWVESADNDGAVDKSPGTSASGSKHERKQVKKTAEEKGKRKVMEDEEEATKHDTSASGSRTKSKVEATTKDERKQVRIKRKQQGGDTVDERRKSYAKRRKEGPALAEVIEEKKPGSLALAEVIEEKKPGSQKKGECRGIWSWMAMGCVATAGFTARALILVAFVRYVEEETDYLFPT